MSRFAGVKLGADALLGPAGGALPFIDEAVDFATALLCADAIGAMQYANDATLDYLKTRKQFGVPIASFQVLQHRMVEMFIAHRTGALDGHPGGEQGRRAPPTRPNASARCRRPR